MENGKQVDGYEDEGAVEDEEAGFVLHDVVAPSAGHFSNSIPVSLYFQITFLVDKGESLLTKKSNRNRRREGNGNIPVNATDQNRRISTHDPKHKHPKLSIPPQRQLLRLSRTTPQMLPRPQEVIRAENAKDSEDQDLQHYTGDDGAVTVLLELGFRVACCGGDASADGLDDEAAEVGGEEDSGIPLGRDAGELGAEVEGDVFEGEVDGYADEGGGEDDGADLEFEGGFVVGVVVEEDAADVACLMLVVDGDGVDGVDGDGIDGVKVEVEVGFVTGKMLTETKMV